MPTTQEMNSHAVSSPLAPSTYAPHPSPSANWHQATTSTSMPTESGSTPWTTGRNMNPPTPHGASARHVPGRLPTRLPTSSLVPVAVRAESPIRAHFSPFFPCGSCRRLNRRSLPELATTVRTGTVSGMRCSPRWTSTPRTSRRPTCTPRLCSVSNLPALPGSGTSI